jgi:hypothetical protein
MVATGALERGPSEGECPPFRIPESRRARRVSGFSEVELGDMEVIPKLTFSGVMGMVCTAERTLDAGVGGLKSTQT